MKKTVFALFTVSALFLLVQCRREAPFDKSLYEEITLRWYQDVLQNPSKETKYYKVHAVFLGRSREYIDIDAGNGSEYFVFYEQGVEIWMPPSVFEAPETLPGLEPGQYAAVYLRVFPEKLLGRSGGAIETIDHIEILPFENIPFRRTHRTTGKMNISIPGFIGLTNNTVLFTVNPGVEVEVARHEYSAKSTVDETGKELPAPGHWVWVVTPEGYRGWALSSFLEPLPPEPLRGIDKSLYKKQLPRELYWDSSYGNVLSYGDFDKEEYLGRGQPLREIDRVIRAAEYCKTDAVVKDRKPYEEGADGTDIFEYFELEETDGRVSFEEFSLLGSAALPPVEPGQLISIYYRMFPENMPDGKRATSIDRVEFPAEGFSFTATHRTTGRTDITSPASYYSGEKTLFTLDAGVEIEVRGEYSSWVWLVSGGGYWGWTLASNLEALPQTGAAPPRVMPEYSPNSGK